MHLAANVFDVWAFQRTDAGTRFLLLRTSEEKARRHFNDGTFWQIPSGFVNEGEAITDAIGRELNRFDLTPTSIWAGEHAYIIYNRRFLEMQIIGVYAAEVVDAPVRLDAAEHSEYAWLPVRGVARPGSLPRPEGWPAGRPRIHYEPGESCKGTLPVHALRIWALARAALY